MIPVAAVGWWLGRAPALIVASAAAIAWFLADIGWHQETAPSLWNAGTRLIMYGALGYMLAMLRDDREQMRVLLAQERRAARTDPLTTLMNSRAFYERAGIELARSRRAGSSLALAYIDLDNFKAVNDQYGHARGDDLLQEVAAAARRTLRGADVAARLGGDEFAVLLLDVARDAASAVAHRILAAIDSATASFASANVGASIGVSWFERPPRDVEALVAAAGAAMYRAKAGGKRRVHIECV